MESRRASGERIGERCPLTQHGHALVFDVPVLGLAAITSTLVQGMGSLIGIWLTVMVGVFAGIVARGGAPPPFASSGIQWMTPAYWRSWRVRRPP